MNALYRFIRRCRRAACLLFLGILMVGCSGKSTGPIRVPGEVGPVVSPSPVSQPIPQPQTDLVARLLASVKLTQVDLATGEYLNPGQLVRVGTGPVTLSLSFRALMSQSAVDSRVQIQAAEQPRRYWRGNDLMVLEFAGGRDGEQAEVRLLKGLQLPDGGELAGDVVFAFARVEGARVNYTLNGAPLEWPREGRSWLPVSGRVELGLRFSKAVNRESVVQALRANARGGDGNLELAVAWVNDTMGKLTAERQNGQELLINLAGAVDEKGSPLTIPAPPLRLRWEEGSTFWAVSPAGRDETVVAKVPHRVAAAVAGPGGLRIAYLEDDGQAFMRLWVLHLGSEQRWDTGIYVPAAHHLAWVDGSQLLAHTGDQLWLVDSEQKNTLRLGSGSIVGLGGSGDGVAGWLVAIPERNGTRYDLHLRPSAGPEQILAGILWRPSQDLGSLVMPLALSRQARRAALPLAASPVPSITLVDLELAGMGVLDRPAWSREVPVDAPVLAGTLAFSPGGTAIVAGTQVIEVGSGRTRIKLSGAAQAHWSVDGRRILVTPESGPGSGNVQIVPLEGGRTVTIRGSEALGWTEAGYVLVRRP